MSVCFQSELSYNVLPMKINIMTILQEVGSSFSTEYDELLQGEQADEDFILKTPIYVQATLTNSGVGVIVKGVLEATLELNCSTCLSPFEHKFSLSFDERFVSSMPTADDGLEEEYEIVGDENFYYTYDEHEIDFSNMIRELLILNLPIAPKCDINCRVKKLEKTQTIDPRFKLLERLKDGG